MNSRDILYGKNKNDECYTLDYAVKPILKYIPTGAVVWCPFDKENSEFVKQIRVLGNKVIASHIDNGQDFFHLRTRRGMGLYSKQPAFCEKT